MIYFNLLLSSAFVLICWACNHKDESTSRCATALTYVTKGNTIGEEAIRKAGQYRADILMGTKKNAISAVLDTGSANLVINGKDFEYDAYTATGIEPYLIKKANTDHSAITAMDSLDLACTVDLSARFSITSKASDLDNILGLGYRNVKKKPYEKKNPPFIDQVIRESGLKNEFSLALCGARGNSRLILGGIDADMSGLLGDFIPIIDETGYAVPAINIVRADNKQLVGEFPDPYLKQKLVMIDSAAAFMLFTPEMAKKIAEIVEGEARSGNIYSQFPNGFFRTERGSSTKVIRFASLAQIRQFPAFEINFQGDDGQMKALELSPLHYFKEMDTKDPLIRTFAIRESNGDVILGQPFLENHYAYFDRKNARIGFANIDIACTH